MDFTNASFLQGIELGLSKEAAPWDKLRNAGRWLVGADTALARPGAMPMFRKGNLDDLAVAAAGKRIVDPGAKGWFGQAVDVAKARPRQLRDMWRNQGRAADTMMERVQQGVGRESDAGKGILESHKTIREALNKKMLQHAGAGAAAGGVGGIATAEEGEGIQGLMRGAALGGLGGAALGRHLTKGVRSDMGAQLRAAGAAGSGGRHVDDMLDVYKMRKNIGGDLYNPMKKDLSDRVTQIKELQKGMGGLARDVGQNAAMNPVAAAAAGGGTALGGGLMYQHMRGKRKPQMPYSYYPHGGR